MSQHEDPAQAATRLENALERIARSAARAARAPSEAPAEAGPDRVDREGELAARLDALIAELRAVLDGTPKA